MTKLKEEWEGEFIEVIDKYSAVGIDLNGHKAEVLPQMRDFINNLLSSQRTQLLEEIKRIIDNRIPPSERYDILIEEINTLFDKYI